MPGKSKIEYSENLFIRTTILIKYCLTVLLSTDNMSDDVSELDSKYNIQLSCIIVV